MPKLGSQPEWKGGFLFLGNQLVLDFVNTRPVQDGEPIELLHDFDAVLRWFQAADILSSGKAGALRRDWGKTERAQNTAEALRELREKLRFDILAWEGGGTIRRSTVDELNRLMAAHPARTRLSADRNAHSTQTWFKLEEPEDLIAPIVYSAAMLFSVADRERVRKCGRCILHFHDTSKRGTRRWCSMRLCGNRLKVAAYAARRRSRT
jgi:predicted RNA-binding Zn ribbon-like protein